MRPSTALHVLNTPLSIIESTSTEDLLDDLISESTRTVARRPIMLQFDPTGASIWRRWKGTIFSETWRTCIRNMAFATVVAVFFKLHPRAAESLQGFNILWAQLLSVTTFTLTFFLNVSYGLWRTCYQVSRRLQGRLNDLGLTLAAHAVRTNATVDAATQEFTPSTYTPEASQLLQFIGRYVRVFNLLCYASFTRSHRPILTPRGMRRLVDRGVLTKWERDSLVSADVPATQRHNAVLIWITRAIVEGREGGLLLGGPGMEQHFMDKVHMIRAQYGAIGDELSGRMPLAYAHIVQVLVDVVLWLYPVMSFPSGMGAFLGVLGTGLLTIFYQGLFDLAKQFLDPYDNENYGQGDDPLCVDTLIAETNAGSVRWMNGFENQPWMRQDLEGGALGESLLPLNGISVSELREMEEKREMEAAELERAKVMKVNEQGPLEEKEADDTARLPQQLANEVEETLTSMNSQKLQDLPEKLKEFSEKATEALETAKAELKETRAILAAVPGANDLGDDDDVASPAPQEEEEVEEKEKKEKKEEGEEEEVAAAAEVVEAKKEKEKEKEKGRAGREELFEAERIVLIAAAEREVVNKLKNIVEGGMKGGTEGEEDGTSSNAE